MNSRHFLDGPPDLCRGSRKMVCGGCVVSVHRSDRQKQPFTELCIDQYNTLYTTRGNSINCFQFMTTKNGLFLTENILKLKLCRKKESERERRKRERAERREWVERGNSCFFQCLVSESNRHRISSDTTN